MKLTQQHQSGFTLVEIAIVLVIIGLLLGGVLKGQEMIENSRIKSVAADLRGVSAAYNSYVDRFHALPGDELLATMTARGWPATAAAGNANNVLNITPAQTFTNAGEQTGLWQALRAAGFTTGDPAATGVAALPKTGTGGLIGVTVAPYGLTGVAGCVSGLTTKQARGVDTIIDGTEANNLGDARGINGAANPLAPVAAAPAATAYNETTIVNTWTLCRSL
ncbi:prepilin-type N-terminal cleavage/methylation domain-containing protein [Undibacterium sp. RuTC16W]|uniref:prepilin-type N-terminal cleavage/methylation domain-containing protein n=1 Tax=Undibacterium sp. RuTC16W TaxID=3413048 RepID=UPI003BF340AF